MKATEPSLRKQEREAEKVIRRMRDQGKTPKQTAKRIGADPKQVKKILRRSNR